MSVCPATKGQPDLLYRRLPAPCAARLHAALPRVCASARLALEVIAVDTDALPRSRAAARHLRVDHVTYRVPSGFAPDLNEHVRSIVQEFAESVRARRLLSSGVLTAPADDTTHFVWVDDAKVLFERTVELGLTLYAGLMPRLLSTQGIELPDGMPPFAFGQSLYVDFDWSAPPG